MLGIKLGGGFDGFFNVFGKIQGDKIAGGIQVILSLFIDDPDKPVAFTPRVWEAFVDFEDLERGGVVSVIDADEKPWSASIVSHRLSVKST
jgi:hypothetical protein